MSIPNLNARRGLRQRLGGLSESMMGILNPGDSYSRPCTPCYPYALRASHVFVRLIALAITLMVLSGPIRVLRSPSIKTTQNSADRVIPHSLQPGKSPLSISNYPSILVSESDGFKEINASDMKDKSQSSLVSPKSEDEVTHASGVDRDEEPVARLIVLTMDRDKPLKRLLDSLTRANYGEDHVDLDIWIDIANDKPLDEAVLQVATTLEWKYGTKIVHKRKTNAGLYQQWIYTWNITEETTEFAVILEDDLEVSPAFYQWLRLARAAYAQDSDVGAFTLQRSTLRPRQIKGIASGPLNISAEHHVFKYKLLGTWGFAPQSDQWVEFRKWFEEKKAKKEKPYVDGLMTTNWYKKQEVNGFAPNMWSQWWIKFVEEKGYYTVTGHLPDGTTLAANWRESGLHYSKRRPSADFPVYHGTDDFLMPENPILVDWDGRIISSNASSSLSGAS